MPNLSARFFFISSSEEVVEANLAALAALASSGLVLQTNLISGNTDVGIVLIKL